MSRSVPATDRVVATLNLLAEHPGEFFGLSKIAGTLGLNKATAHAMLGTLVDGDYLVRHPVDKTYSLGPALVGLGHAAVSSTVKLAALARPLMDELSTAVDAHCLATTLLGEEIVVIAVAGAPPNAGGLPLGYRSRLAPPDGVIFAAWAAQPRIERWLERLPSPAKDREQGRTLLQVVRARGFSVSGDVGPEQQLDDILQRLPDKCAQVQERAIALENAVLALAREDQELLTIEPSSRYHVRQISTPVFDATGAVRLSLTLTMLGDVTGSRLLDLATALRAASTALTVSIGGTRPEVQDPRTESSILTPGVPRNL